MYCWLHTPDFLSLLKHVIWAFVAYKVLHHFGDVWFVVGTRSSAPYGLNIKITEGSNADR